LAHGSLSLIASAGYCEARAGRRAEAEKVLAHLNEISSERYVSPLHKAVVHIGLGDVDAAFMHLGESIRERSFVLLLPKTNPIFDLLRGDDRFRELLKTAGIA
jgi:hypothetical protein